MTKTLPGRMLSELDKRTEFACAVFTRICAVTKLHQLLGEQTSWAFVGGAVRDALLNQSTDELYLLPPWPDVDVALTSQLDVVASAIRNSTLTRKIVSNHFGGVKARIQGVGHLDLWMWPGSVGTDESEWLTILENCDFGTNAVAFVWPQQKIVIHPRWIEDLQKRSIEKLAAESPLRQLQPIRATALLSRLSTALKARFRLGPKTSEDFRWLLQGAEYQIAIGALEYLREKLDTGRWPDETKLEFGRLSKGIPRSRAFNEALDATFGGREAQLGRHTPMVYFFQKNPRQNRRANPRQQPRRLF